MTLRLLILMLLFVSPSWAAMTCPQEPPGSTVLAYTDFNSATGNGFVDMYAAEGLPSLMSIVSNQDGPASPPNALQAYYPMNHPGGNGTGKVNFETSGRKELFVCFLVKLDAPFQNHPTGTKIIYIAGPENVGNGHPYYFLMQGGPPYRLTLVSQGPIELNNKHLGGICPWEGTCNLPQNGPGGIYPGRWHRISLYLKQGPDLTGRRAIAKWWIDDDLAGNYTNLNTRPQDTYTGVHINPVYGGAATDANGNPIFKTQPDYMWFDAMKVSDPSGGAPPVTPPQPPQPPQPAKLPGPDILAPLRGATVPAGPVEFRWSAIPGAGQYILNVHEEGQSYDCTMMSFCGNLPGTSKLVTLKAGKKVDWWVQTFDQQGNPGLSNGGSFTVQASPATPLPIEPPPVQPPPVEPPPVQPPPVVTPPSGPVFSNIREGVDQKGRPALSFEFQDAACPKGTRRTLKGHDTKTITIVCER